jgi:hypothetical protein
MVAYDNRAARYEGARLDVARKPDFTIRKQILGSKNHCNLLDCYKNACPEFALDAHDAGRSPATCVVSNSGDAPF